MSGPRPLWNSSASQPWSRLGRLVRSSRNDQRDGRPRSLHSQRYPEPGGLGDPVNLTALAPFQTAGELLVSDAIVFAALGYLEDLTGV